ncbi:MAG: DUF6776 family protein [Pseudomonadota bacterium]|nr:DUF6776 family protein [Pseudomonadota bacterium]
MNKRLAVVEFRPGHQRLRWLVVGAVALAAALAGFLAAHQDLVQEIQRSETDLAEVLKLRDAAQETLAVERRRRAELERMAAVDRLAAERVQEANLQLRERVVALEKQVALYKQVMAPTSGDEGLNIRTWSIAPAGAPGQYRYSLVIQQLSYQHAWLQGWAEVNLIGTQDGEPAVLPLVDLSPEVEAQRIRLRFRYFQKIDGALSLPAGFRPERVQVVAERTGKVQERREKLFQWGGKAA